MVWEQAQADIVQSSDGFIIFDDTVIDKNYSKNIESVRWQYSGNAHGIIRGIGLVNCVYVNPESDQFWLIDYRLFDPDRDGKSKMQHVKDMLNNLFHHKNLRFSTVLMDSWYANKQLMLHIHRLGKIFYCPIAKNRLAYVEEPTLNLKQYPSFLGVMTNYAMVWTFS